MTADAPSDCLADSSTRLRVEHYPDHGARTMYVRDRPTKRSGALQNPCVPILAHSRTVYAFHSLQMPVFACHEIRVRQWTQKLEQICDSDYLTCPLSD